jgi:hypothetical protein
MQVCDTPQRAADYWRLHIEDNPYFHPERECFAVLFLNTRRRVKGHQLLTQGTGDNIPDPDAKWVVLLGQLLEMRGDNQGALKSYNRALKLSSTGAMARWLKAKVLELQ